MIIRQIYNSLAKTSFLQLGYVADLTVFFKIY